MDMLLQALRGFFKRVHLMVLNQGQLTVMISLADREQTCTEIVTETGYDRSTVRQILQRLKQLEEVDMRAYRASGHGQVEYVYTLTCKGSKTLAQCLGEFDVLMARVALGENAAALGDVKKKMEKENARNGKEDGESENVLSDSLLGECK